MMRMLRVCLPSRDALEGLDSFFFLLKKNTNDGSFLCDDLL